MRPALGQVVLGAVLGLLVVRRVGRQPGHLGLDQGGASASSRPVHGLAPGGIAGEHVRTVHDDARDAVPGSPHRHVLDRDLPFGRDADRIAVVLHDEHERQHVDRGKVERLVDVALVGAPLPHDRDRDLAGPTDLGGERDPHRVQDLGGHGRRDADEVVLKAAVVPGHLAAAGARIGGLRVLGEHQVTGAHPEGQTGGDGPVEGRDPVVTPLECPGQPDLRAFVALAADDERDPARAVQDPQPLVHGTCERDRPVHRQDVRVGQPDAGREGARRGVAAVAGERHRVLRAAIGRWRPVPPSARPSEVDRPAVDRHGCLAQDLRERRVGVRRGADLPWRRLEGECQ